MGTYESVKYKINSVCVCVCVCEWRGGVGGGVVSFHDLDIEEGLADDSLSRSLSLSLYIYIYREREREKERDIYI